MEQRNTHEAEGVHPIVSENILWVTAMRRWMDKQTTNLHRDKYYWLADGDATLQNACEP